MNSAFKYEDAEVVLTGWFYNAKQDPKPVSPDRLRAVLDPHIWHYRISKMCLKDIRISPLKRIEGSFWNATPVRAVFALESSMPFFIREEWVVRLQRAVQQEMRRYILHNEGVQIPLTVKLYQLI